MAHCQTKTFRDRNEVMLSKTFKVVVVLLFFSLCLPLVGHSQTADRVGELIQKLKSPDFGVRWAAAEALSEIGKPAVEPLIAALKDESWE